MERSRLVRAFQLSMRSEFARSFFCFCFFFLELRKRCCSLSIDVVALASVSLFIALLQPQSNINSGWFQADCIHFKPLLLTWLTNGRAVTKPWREVVILKQLDSLNWLERVANPRFCFKLIVCPFYISFFFFYQFCCARWLLVWLADPPSPPLLSFSLTHTHAILILILILTNCLVQSTARRISILSTESDDSGTAVDIDQVPPFIFLLLIDIWLILMLKLLLEISNRLHSNIERSRHYLAWVGWLVSNFRDVGFGIGIGIGIFFFICGELVTFLCVCVCVCVWPRTRRRSWRPSRSSTIHRRSHRCRRRHRRPTRASPLNLGLWAELRAPTVAASWARPSLQRWWTKAKSSPLTA